MDAPGDRRGDGLLCLLDSLAQTLNGVRPGQYRGFDNVETRAQALLDRMEGRLGSDHVVIRDLRSARGAEVYSGGFLNALAELFQVRVQVVEQGGDRRWYGHPVVGRDGNAPLMLVEFVSPGSGGRGGPADEEMGTFYPLFVDTVHAAALGGAATITDHLIQRWEALVGGHAERIDRLQAAERPLVEAAERGQDVGQARSVLDRLSDRYLDGLRDLRLARGSRDLSEYVRSVSDIAALSGRIGRIEAAAAELDAHVGQAPAGAATPPPLVSPQLLTGHTGMVRAVTSWQEESGRRLLASASLDETVRIWDAADGRPVRTLEDHTGPVSAVTSWQEASGRRLLASASGDGTVRIWDAADGRLIRTLEGHTDAVWAVTSWQEESGRRLLASASGDGTVRIWDAADGRLLRTLEGHTDEVSAVTSWQEESGGRLLASASGDETVRIWDAADGRLLRTLDGHTGEVSAVTSWQEESGRRLLASASGDGTVRIWDAADGRLVRTLDGHTDEVSAVTSWQEESGRRLLASASVDETVRIWDAADGRLIQTLEDHTDMVLTVTSWPAGPGRRMLASAGGDQTVRLWTLPDAAAGLAGLPAVPGGRVAAGNDPGPVPATSVGELGSGNLGAWATYQGPDMDWQPSAPSPAVVVSPQLLTGHTGPVSAVTSWQEESGRRMLASASWDETVRIWDAADGRLVGTLAGHTDAVSAVTSWQAASGRRLLASAGEDGTVRIWDAADGRLIRTLEGHTRAVWAVTSWQAASGQRLLASASGDRTVRIWDAADGRLIRTLEGHTGQVLAVTSWQDESGRRLLASTSTDRTVRIWDAADGRLLQTLEGHTGPVSAVTSWQEESGQRLLASASGDETVRIWDAADGRLLQTLAGHTGPVSAVTSWQAASGQRLLASASGDRTVRIWDAADGRLIRTLEGHTGSVFAVTSWEAGPGRRMLASAGRNQTVRLWPLPDGAAGLAGLPAVPGGRVGAGNDPAPVLATSVGEVSGRIGRVEAATAEPDAHVGQTPADAATPPAVVSPQLLTHTGMVSAVTSWQEESGQRLLASASWDQTVRIWDAADGRLLQTLDGHTDPVYAVTSWQAGRASGCWPPPAGTGRYGSGMRPTVAYSGHWQATPARCWR
ncbi:WD40 repeat protein [Micromonospora olivasterospora]|uniref:WD40 repeat protein n=1 Tax=Micromonospora olivasterospora TaxID=1880 RepID=A0A562IFH2_MICOL|nr:WD40 repeat protein [Micromonospora olivasterospora]